MNSRKRGWLEADKICIAKGNAVALNLMFENKQDHQLFLKLWDKYLGKMTEVMNYHLTPTGWTALFKTKSKREIQQAYHQQRANSNKAKKMHCLTDVSRMLSEHFRIFLSQYARKINLKYGRRGTLVLEHFHKFVLKQKVDYNKVFSLFTCPKKESPQKNPKYREDESKYDSKNEIVKDDICITGNAFWRGLEGGNGLLRCMMDRRRYISVLRKLNLPSNIHQIPPPFT